MLGVNYESSDEEEQLPAIEAKLVNVSTAPPAPKALPNAAVQKGTPIPPTPVSGPAQGPTASPPPSSDNDPVNELPPGSPYISSRAIVQNLTLPAVPNFDIPPSPPGSPPQRATKKFAQFLELKKRGQHFNQRLESSAVLRDPGHSQKLMDFAGISEEQQYASTLSKDLAVPAMFPPWAYVEELRASQKRFLQMREQKQSGAPREFVSAANSGAASRTSTPSGTTGKRKGLEHRSREVSPKRRR
ncbi:hypothetical protein E8E12_008711 [Didymella heteroderae]|uniref:Uncharacterized protein n=1 Tax=Didymella heteroderae TaxID=1769908 RepID=A0A9P4WQS2_9PLEO|nr:hypothetical protein E8E12_008711 [Didymella heteroderae]